MKAIKTYSVPLLLVSILVAAALSSRSTGNHLRAQGRPPRPLQPDHAIKIEFPEVEDSRLDCPTPGVLDIHAVLDIVARPGVEPEFFAPYVVVWRPTAANDPDWETVWSQEYPRQVIATEPGGHLRPEFRQRVQMPPGAYVVKVGLRMLQWGWGRDDVGHPPLVPAPVPGPSRSFHATVH
jgi:hypothetical protein